MNAAAVANNCTGIFITSDDVQMSKAREYCYASKYCYANVPDMYDRNAHMEIWLRVNALTCVSSYFTYMKNNND